MFIYILSILLIIGVCLISYIYKLAKKKYNILCEHGYEMVIGFLEDARNLSYYRQESLWISNKYSEVYKELLDNCDKWYVRLIGNHKINRIIEFYQKADIHTKTYSPYFSLDHYFAYSEYVSLKHCEEQTLTIAKEVVGKDINALSIRKGLPESYVKHVATYDMTLNISRQRDSHNNEFVRNELKVHKAFFDKVQKHPLDQQQRESIVKLEDNCLVISSAGSGKTTTSIAKVKYLLEKRNLHKEEILVLSYNRKTAEEFEKKLEVPGLTCKTFHALALDIIGKAEGSRPDICSQEFLLECFYTLVKKSDEYKDAITKYIGEIASITKGEHEYENAEPYYKDRETYGIMAPYGDMNGSPIFTRSEEEKKICTWLTTHGVDFLYEQSYPYDTSDEQHRQYKPDFTIYYTKNGKRYYLFLEHFGIDKDGNVPSWFGEGTIGGFFIANKAYNEGIKWKRQLHKDNGTLLIETQSAMFHDGSIYRKLEQQLREAGVDTRELSPEEKFHLLFERNEAMEGNVMNLFSSFISLMKSNGKTFDSIMESIEKSDLGKDFAKRCRYLMFDVIKPLYDEYESSLRANHQMDFTDLILHAANLCNTKKWKTPFSYILVDEFQDISVDRFKFLMSLRKESPLTKMYCVGDDWQSIYRFSGSDMNLFNNYSKYFGFTQKCKIETTYRFGNPLISRSSRFILRNPSQVSKVVKPCTRIVYSNKDNIFTPKSVVNKTNLSFIPFTRGNNNSSYLDAIKKIIVSIPMNESIMLLGRYNYEVKVFPRSCIEDSATSKRAKVTFAGRKMNFMSVHAAKGLEADHVIILNCSQDGGGFPSRVSDDPILGFVLSEIDTFEYSEERRLFYVAITRAKKHSHVMYNEGMPSIFVTEIMEQGSDDILLCPVCKKGSLKSIKEAVAKNGKYYRNYVCNNSVAGCSFFWRVFYDEEEEIIDIYHNQMDKHFK